MFEEEPKETPEQAPEQAPEKATEESGDLNPHFAPKKKRGPKPMEGAVPGRHRTGDETPEQLEEIRKVEREYMASLREAQREMEGKPESPKKGRPVLANTVIKDIEIGNVFKNIWGIRNRNVIDQCLENGLERAHELSLVSSLPYWRDGADSEYSIDVIGGRSEVLSMRELYALYIFTVKGLKVLGAEITFEEWLDLRDRARKDLYWLAKEVLGIPLVEEVHRKLIETMFPKLNADGMFTMDYKLTDMHDAINRQTEIKEVTIFDPRFWMKTAETSAFVLQFLLNFPEARVFDISGTDDLAEGFLRIMKGYLGHSDGGVMQTVNQLFPEYTLRGKDATSAEPVLLPNRRFYQKDYSFSTFGWAGAASGKHCDLFVADDVVQEKGSEVTRETLKNKVDSLASNIPDTHAIKLILGTRYDLNDWYSHRIKFYEEDPTSMKLWSRGVLVPKEGFEDLSIQELLEDLDKVHLNWPNHYGTPAKTLAEYRKKAKLNLNDFLHQQMNSPISSEDLDNKIAFDMEKFPNLFIDPASFPREGDQYLIVDIAWSQDKRADFSVALVGRIGKSLSSAGELSAYVDHIDAKRRKSSELALTIVELSMKYNLKSIIVEKIGGVEAVLDEVRRQAQLRNHVLPHIYAAPVILTTQAKWRRIKTLELAFAQSRFWFSKDIHQTQIALTMDQFGKYTGKRSSTRHDDIPDTCALFWNYCMPREDATGKEKKEIDEQSEKAYAEQVRRENYQRIFGNESKWHVGMPTNEAPVDTGREIGVTRGAWGIPGLRTPAIGPKQDPERKPITFSSAPKPNR